MPRVVLAAMNPVELFDLELRVLLEAVYQRYHYDFRDYAVSSLRRRMRHAMARFDCARVADLQHRLLHEPDTFAQAMQFFTVQVSEMFRDPAYFRMLREHAVPVLRTYPSIKLWVAGCSTGEEVWSLAILLHEEGLLEKSVIYATDINPEALSLAEAGAYGIDRIAQFSRNYLDAGGRTSLSDYYTTAYNGAVFDRRLKRNIVFADHSLATDTVFSEVHLVSCRNVLIYFNRSLQDRAVGLFYDALVHRGFLGLGSKESLQFGAHAQAFEACAREQRLYRKAA
ncbi:CheR family methyltransferase [Xanthomonas vasicola]|uniref:Chemotaxis protein CheR n=3 Tax=Xanthomonas vasicola TaxID=56459 RepID=A0A836P3A7_XANVA|nr:CheR family methyltransferase [Xanthomonas vasicola]MBV6744874.1 protein-glutamate O-methyltransferase CheR [Xanthomonas vasicola pv. vasculorum NCPPB 890]KEZ97500.1 chemotaxis protein CheR [Xanthomonas vasicola pv. vasculorum NCPPB 895]KFA23491.1 chemotaxis protein CheR [Xanthomonas vasicola pv. vasculorum NCPPB 1326]KFA26648.1 chemotaxis protein CheR [Xanthomonas vasicola pv. vasculorum NCPPB 1381]KFA37004.1 chemotaxis protein CheR [Xanthomonas vasicola pv. vasculorum NCPPB 206]